MVASNFWKDSVFPDQGRLLQLATSGDTGDDSEFTFDAIAGIYIVGLAMVIMVNIWCVITVRRCVATRRVNAMDTPEMTNQKKLNKMFETSRVTMVSKNTEMARPT
jgi:hypothetical protein